MQKQFQTVFKGNIKEFKQFIDERNQQGVYLVPAKQNRSGGFEGFGKGENKGIESLP